MSKDKGITIIDGNPVELYAGDFPRVELPVVIASGAGALIKGTVLGKVTATGKYVAYNDGNADGSQTAKCILADDIDATSEDINTTAYFAGHFNEDALTGIDAAAKVDFEGTPLFVSKIA
ncbi:MAG: hypothetical protein Kow0098_03600 [Ignavibacteriaceae bacterium]